MTFSDTLRIALIGPSRFPVSQPFVGGLEAHVWALSAALRARGHHVTLFAAAGSDPEVADEVVAYPPLRSGGTGRRDISKDAALVQAENSAYDAVMASLVRRGRGSFDVIHNHALHPVPLAAVDRLDVPMVSTFHTPPIPRMVEALVGITGRNLCLVAVSRHAAASWSTLADEVHVVHNGVDTRNWRFGPGGDRLIWSGRLVPEKGAELAIAAARIVGRPLDLAGPVGDEGYFRQQIEPLLGSQVRYLGHLDHRELSTVVGHSRAALVTPRWDEPYGLVVAEALACGTPVAAFARGGIPEILSPRCGRLARADDVEALASAAVQAAELNRVEVRTHAEELCSMERMVSEYESIYYSHLNDRVGPSGHALVRRHPHDHGHMHRHARSRGHASAVSPQ